MPPKSEFAIPESKHRNSTDHDEDNRNVTQRVVIALNQYTLEFTKDERLRRLIAASTPDSFFLERSAAHVCFLVDAFSTDLRYAQVAFFHRNSHLSL